LSQVFVYQNNYGYFTPFSNDNYNLFIFFNKYYILSLYAIINNTLKIIMILLIALFFQVKNLNLNIVNLFLI
jgi:hypothetical protein